MSCLVDNENGSVLGMVLIFFLVLTITGTAFLSLSALEGQSGVRQIQRHRAFFLAESGLSIGFWRLNHGADHLCNFSDEQMTVLYDSSNQTLTATGMVGQVTRTVRVNVFEDYPFNHIVAYQNQLDTSNFYLSCLDGHGIAWFSSIPAPDLNYYYSRANYIYNDDQTFDGTMPDGIYFVDGSVTMKNGTTLNGTMIVTGGIKFIGQVTISAQQMPDTNLYYPAIIAADTAQTESDVSGTPQLTINGMVYSSGFVLFKGKLISGPIVANKVILKSGVDIDDGGSLRYYHYPPGFPGAENFDWHKMPVAGTWHRTG